MLLEDCMNSKEIDLEIEEWREKKKAVRALGDSISGYEMRNMLKGIDSAIEELLTAKQKIEKEAKSEKD